MTGEARLEGLWRAVEQLQEENRQLRERQGELDNRLRSIGEMIEDRDHH